MATEMSFLTVYLKIYSFILFYLIQDMKALENEADFISATQKESESAESIKKEAETKENIKKVAEVEKEFDELGESAPNSAWPSPNPESSFRAKLQGKTSIEINFSCCVPNFCFCEWDFR
jgi:hypothetical protein